MKLWDELNEEERKALIQLIKDIYKIIDEAVVIPLSEIIDNLSWFFTILAGIIIEGEKIDDS